MADRGGRGSRGARGGGGRGGGRGAGRGDRGDWGGGRGSDRGGRGDRGGSEYRGGRGRGGDRGGSEYRGGGGRGDRGGSEYRGGGRGDRGGSEYRGGGGRGDRGGYEYRGGRGDRGGYRGDGGDRGRGRGRGGGGFRGGRGGFSREEDVGKSMAFSYEGDNPTPDAAITALEDKIVKQQKSSLASLTSQMASLNVKGKGTQSDLLSELFPARPAFGAKGQPVVLWANYFRVNVNPGVFYRYNLTVAQLPSKEDKQAESSNEGGKSRSKGKPKGEPKDRDVRGRKLYFVIKAVMSELWKKDETLVAATEFKSQLITLKPLQLEHNPMRVQVPKDPDSDIIDTFDVTFHGPVEALVDDLKKYLTSMEDKTNSLVFPRFPEVVDALNVIFGYGPRWKLDEVSAVGSSRFFPFGDDKVIKDLQHNWHALVAARGYFQSSRLGTGRLLLNTNITHGIFKISGKLSEIFDNLEIRAVSRNDGRGMRKLNAFSKFLPKTRVWVTMKLANGKEVRRSKAIHSLATESEVRRRAQGPDKPQFTPGWEFAGPKNVQFLLDDGDGRPQWTTVANYCKQKYGRDFSDYPLVNLGRADKPTYVPAELIEIQPGQSCKAKLTMEETTAMLDFACRSPYSNALSISTDSRKVLGLDDELLNDFGVSVDKKLLTVQGRVLSAPMVSYLSTDGKSKRVDVAPRNGSWNMRSVRVVKPGTMFQRWTFVNVLLRGHEEPVDPDVVYRFAKFMSNDMGIAISKQPIAPPTMQITRDRAMSGDLERFFDWSKDNQIQLIVVMLSDKDTSGLYARVKTLGDCVYGIHTSCVVARQFGKGNPGYFANVGLKVNLKAGGVNHKLRDEFGILKDGKTMIVGYDVTHPTNMNITKGNEPPSLVGLVASIDRDLGQWPACAWEQSSKQEMLTSRDEVLGDRLIEAFASRLKLWQKHNQGKTPENIVIYRDGVSEGQFAQVIEKELPSIREACKKGCPPKFQPKLTILVSVKRHHTRFYPTRVEDMSSSGNIRNGTVVDRGVTQVRYWDFFLTAHDALKGTAKPAHYTVLLDEIFRARHKEEAANEVERLTHELCYLFGRATKAVSICPPAYYADIVCERARAHRPEWFDVSDVESVTTAGGQASSTSTGGRAVHSALQDTMYYI